MNAIQRGGVTWRLVAALAIAAGLVGGLGAQQKSARPASQFAGVLLGAALHQEEVAGQLEAAIATYRQVLKAPDATREQQARAHLHIGICYEQLGNAEARNAYEEVLRAFADQAELVGLAKARLGVLASRAAPPSPAASGPVMRQLWPDTKGALWTRVSSDGRLVVGVDDDTGDLVVRDIAGGPIRRLTNNPTDRTWVDYADEPIWSSDSRRIACVWATDAKDRAKYAAVLRIVQLEPLEIRDIKVDERFVLQWMRDWSHDGTRVLGDVKEKATGRTSLAWVSTEAGEVQPLGVPGENRKVWDAFVSPDGARIVYMSLLWDHNNVRSESAIHLLPSAGGTAETLLASSDQMNLLGWATTGDDILFVSVLHDEQQLMRLPIESGAAPVAVRAVPFRFGLGITRTGALVYTASTPSRRDVYRADFDPSTGSVQNRRKVSAPASRINSSPVWSKDGHWLAFMSRQARDYREGALTFEAAGAQPKSIPLPFSPIDVRPAHDTGGRGWLVATADGQRGYGLYRVDAESGTVEPVLPIEAGVFNFYGTPRRSLAGWSPDGRTVYKRVNYDEKDGGQVAMVAHRVADHAEQEIFRSAGRAGIGLLDVSPDGSRLLFSLLSETGRKGSRLVAMPAAGGPTSTVFESVSPANLFGGRWSDDGRTVVVSTYTAGTSDTWKVDLASGSRQRIDCGLSPVYNVALSPNGREIAFHHALPQQDDGLWILENSLPPAPAPAAKPPQPARR